MAGEFDHAVFTGPIDQFYGCKYGRLGYRTVYWSREEHPGDFQGNAVINYPGLEEPFTRIHEHKHFAPWEDHERTLVFTEFSKETAPGDIPYYPKRLATDNNLLNRYWEEARRERHVSFLGRLATYRYMDMHQVIGEAMDFAPLLAQALAGSSPPPVFPPWLQL
jgi:UDP-galactopyranose mutase